MPEPAGERTEFSHTPDARFAEALRPALTAALKKTLQEEPRIWAEALLPTILPAVRMAVSAALRGMLRTLNQLLEEGLSLRSWKWRLEAWRTGKSFGEIVLLRTLVYRVEQVLLLDRHAGLLLAWVANEGVVPRDSQLISAMLTALQDFVNESFEVNAESGMRELHVGECSLLVETGPRAALAAAVRGNPPAELRETLRAAIDLIHQEFLTELVEFRGDARPFERAKVILEGCLQAQYQRPEARSYTKLWVAVGVLAALLATWIGFRAAEARRWERAVSTLRSDPGILITQAERRSGRYLLEGLHDPLARRPEDLLQNEGVDPGKVSTHFQPYLSLDPELVIRRSRMVLSVPAGVTLSLEKEALKAAGAAPHAWLRQARDGVARLSFLGIRKIDVDGVADQDMQTLGSEIESGAVRFEVGSSSLRAEQIRAAKDLAAKTREWLNYASESGKPAHVAVLGYADRTGTDETNSRLSRARAQRLAELLAKEGVPAEWLSFEGRGGTGTDGEPAVQRRATIRLTASEPTGSPR